MVNALVDVVNAWIWCCYGMSTPYEDYGGMPRNANTNVIRSFAGESSEADKGYSEVLRVGSDQRPSSVLLRLSGMKTRESGMPDESMWQGFFDPQTTLRKLGLHADSGDVLDFGCGYGTFTIPAARIARGIVYAIDIEPAMVEATRTKADSEHLANVHVSCRDFVEAGTALPGSVCGFVMLFNILHCEQPGVLLREAWRVLAPDGTLAVMHWNHDASTPRGPRMDIRPRPEQCRAWAAQAGFEACGPALIDLPPYHYGLTFHKPRHG